MATTVLDVIILDIDSLRYKPYNLCVAIMIETISQLILLHNERTGEKLQRDQVMEDYLLSVRVDGQQLDTDNL